MDDVGSVLANILLMDPAENFWNNRCPGCPCNGVCRLSASNFLGNVYMPLEKTLQERN